VGNAVKYSFPDTLVQVSVERSASDVTVSVSDQGKGIPEKELHKLFKPFGRTNVTATAGERSTGLGLAIVRKIVEGHGGQIGVRSQLGTGSTFRFSLPVPS